MKLADTQAALNGDRQKLPAAPALIDSEPYVPMRFVGSVFDVKATWDVLNRSLYLFKNDQAVRIASASPSENEGSSTAVPDPSPAGGKAETPQSPILSNKQQSQLADYSITQVLKKDTPAKISSIESQQDRIIIQADRDLQPLAFTLPDPQRIVLDLPYAEFDSKLNGKATQQNGEIASDHPYIEHIRYALFANDPSTVRIVIDLNRKAEYSIQSDTQNHRLILSIPAHVYKVVLDPGHGGKDPGASGASKSDEKWFTLSMAVKVADALKNDPSIQVYLTRKDDSFITLDDRVAFAGQLHADLFLSIHANVYDTGNIRGTETYYARSESLPFAELIQRQVVGASGFPDRDVRKMDYRVIKYTTMPAALVEVGYISNKTDESFMLQNAFQEKVAQAIAQAIKQYVRTQ